MTPVLLLSAAVAGLQWRQQLSCECAGAWQADVLLTASLEVKCP